MGLREPAAGAARAHRRLGRPADHGVRGVAVAGRAVRSRRAPRLPTAEGRDHLGQQAARPAGAAVPRAAGGLPLPRREPLLPQERRAAADALGRHLRDPRVRQHAQGLHPRPLRGHQRVGHAGGAHGARGSARRPAEAEHLLHVLRLRHLCGASPRRAVLRQRRGNAPAAHAAAAAHDALPQAAQGRGRQTACLGPLRFGPRALRRHLPARGGARARRAQCRQRRRAREHRPPRRGAQHAAAAAGAPLGAAHPRGASQLATLAGLHRRHRHRWRYTALGRASRGDRGRRRQ
mmetsp:Transcript_22366/g.53089  ORF Transcript_22366/g.53089 Transcript_22366/m.53089 type:complete len:291 (+) Transcript_22366:416-1288(+)